MHDHLADLAMLGILNRQSRNEGRAGGQYYEYEFNLDSHWYVRQSTRSMVLHCQIVFAISCEGGRTVTKNTRHGGVCLFGLVCCLCLLCRCVTLETVVCLEQTSTVQLINPHLTPSENV